MLSLAIDMDEVMADPATKLMKWYERDYGRHFTEEEIQGRDLKYIVPPEHATVFHQYLNTPGFFRDLAILPDAKEIIAKLHSRYNLFVVSAAMEFPNSLRDKFDWLQEYFPFITWQQICLCGSKGLVQTDIIIDDRIKNFKCFKGRKLLFTAHHNVWVEGFERVNNWQEVAGKLL